MYVRALVLRSFPDDPRSGLVHVLVADMRVAHRPEPFVRRAHRFVRTDLDFERPIAHKTPTSRGSAVFNAGGDKHSPARLIHAPKFTPTDTNRMGRLIQTAPLSLALCGTSGDGRVADLLSPSLRTLRHDILGSLHQRKARRLEAARGGGRSGSWPSAA